MLFHENKRYAYPVGTYVTCNEDIPHNDVVKDLILGRVEGYNENGECLYIKYLQSKDKSKVGHYQYYFSWRVKEVQYCEATCKLNFIFE